MRWWASQLSPLSWMLLLFLFFSYVPIATSQDKMALPQGQVGSEYSAQINAEGGMPPLSWRVVSGELPPGLQVSTDGHVVGTPTAGRPGQYVFILTVLDSSEPVQKASMQFSITIKARPLHITGVSQKGPPLKIVAASADDPSRLGNAPGADKQNLDLPAKVQSSSTPAGSSTGSSDASASSATPAKSGGTGQAASPSQQEPCLTGTFPSLIGALATGGTIVDGCAEANVMSVKVGLLLTGSKCPDPTGYHHPVDARFLAAIAGAAGVEFVATLQNPLKNSEQVCLAEINGTGGVVKASGPFPVRSASAVSQNPCSSVKSLPTILDNLVNGQTTLSGCADDESPAVQISVIGAGSPIQCSEPDAAKFAQKPTLYPTVQGPTDAVAQFGVQLPALKTGQQVCLTEFDKNNAPANSMQSAIVVKAGPTDTITCDSSLVAYFPEPPIVGRKVVSGCAGQGPAARVVIYTKDTVDKCPVIFPVPTGALPYGVVDNQLANVDPKTGIFSAEITNPLTDDQLICAYSVTADQKPPVVVTKWGYEDASAPFGRTHYYVTTGVELSQDNQQFSNQDLYLGFSLDRNWIRGRPNSSATAMFNSGFSAQLTSIPVAATSATTTTSTMPPAPSVGTFISSRKAAVVSGDLYAPIYFNAFKGWFGTQTTAFFAPIVKGGLQTITSGALSASAPAPGTTTTTTTVNSAGLYYFWEAGLRLGDLKLHRSWNNAPELISHVDLSFGQWENFKQCRKATNCTPLTNNMFPPGQLYQPLLVVLEGRLDVPKTPIEIGFKSITPLHGAGQGDLRFFFGVKLDVGCIYKTLKGGSTPSFFQCTDDQPATSASETGSAASTATNASASNPTSGSVKKQ